MASETVRVVGYRELVRACDRSGAASKKQVRKALGAAGEVVRADAAERFVGYSAKSAAGFKVSVRQAGVSVRQSLRKTTGKRPDYGALQMTKALLPARAEKTDAIEHEFELALDRVADIFDH